jgi:hypothetical protein
VLFIYFFGRMGFELKAARQVLLFQKNLHGVEETGVHTAYPRNG